MEKVKDFISRYIIFILVFLIILVSLILLLPKEEKKPVVTTPLLTLTLKGNAEVSIVKGETYQDPGYIATDSKEGDLTSRVIVEGSVNSNIIGTYTIKYRVVNSNGNVAEVTRIVNVIANFTDLTVTVDYTPKDLTNEDVTITLKTSGDGFDFILDPDGNVSKENIYNYKATSNNEYLFSIKRKDGNVIEKNIEIKNIDKKKPTGSCKNVVNDQKTDITVTASDESGIKNYSYTFNNKKKDLTSNTYSVNEIARNVVVTVYDKAGNYEMITCIAKDNSWPVKTETLRAANTPKHYYQSLKDEGMEYNLYYPDNLDLNKKNPLVIFLHGYGPTNANAVSNTTFGKYMKEGRFDGAIFLAPSCNPDGKGNWVGCSKKLFSLIDYIVSKYNVDTNRISLTGHSNGGAGVYYIASVYSNKFSAAAVAAGAPSSYNLENLKNLKMVVFYGTKDHNYDRGTSSVKSLQNKGVNLKLYIENGITHDQITQVAYEQYNVVEWLIAQSRN